MSNFNVFQLPLISLLLFTSLFTQNYSVFGSPVVPKQSFTRPDPLRHFRPYTGGYDIRSTHYWASAAFTGVHGYAIAGVWMIFGLGFGSYLIIRSFNGNPHPFVDHPRSYYLVLFAVIALFISLAIIFSSLIMVVNQSSLHRSKNLVDTILRAASDMQQTIRTIINGLLKIQMLLGPYDGQTSQLLNQATHQMRKETISIQNFVEEARHTSDHAIEALYIMNLVFVTINLVVLAAGSVFLFLHWHPGFIIMILFCWILTTVSWSLTGLDFFFHIFVGDTCSAFEDFELNPHDNSIMPILSSCTNSSTSDKFMAQIGYTVHKFIDESNSKVTSLAHQILQTNGQSDDPFKFERICDPFAGGPNYIYNPENCPPDAIQISDLPNILSSLTCNEQIPTKICKTEGRFLPQSSYTKTMAYIESIKQIMATYPQLQSLAECTPVKQAISDVALNQCKPFRALVKLLWSFILSLSMIMVILTLLWITKAYQEKRNHSPICSIFPMPHSP